MNLDETFLAMHVPILGALIAAAFGYSFGVHRDPRLKFIVAYCLVGFIGLFISTYLGRFKIHNIVFLWWFMLAETICLGAYFYRVSDLIRRRFKQVLFGFLILILLACIHIAISDFPRDEYYKNLFIGKCYYFVLITLLVLLHFYDLMAHAGPVRIDLQPEFWISAGILIFAGGSFIPEVSNIYAYEVSNKTELEESRLVRHVVANSIRLIQYVIIILAFRFHYSQKKA